MDLKEIAFQFGSEERKQELKRENSVKKNTGTGNGQGDKKHHEKKKQKSNSIPYVGAPYNFISLPNKVCRYPNKIPSNNVIDPQKYTGEIVYQIEAETPISIDSGLETEDTGSKKNTERQFYRNQEGNYAIPGSTIRGLVRSNVQILSNSSAADDIEDYRIMYRDVAGGHNNKRYKNILGNITDKKTLQNVKAGYLCKEGEGYYIYGTKARVNREPDYHVMSECVIIQKYLEERGESKFSTLLSESHNELQHLPIKTINNRKPNYAGVSNKDFIPHSRKISYRIQGGEITDVAEEGELDYNGQVVFSGEIEKKKAFYIIPEIDLKQVTKLEDKDVQVFQTDFEGKKKQLRVKSSYFALPKEGDIPKPVFYIDGKGGPVQYFGFTPHLRVFYDQSIYDGVPESYRTSDLDYAKALFGYSRDQDSLKSRLSFLDAVVKKKGGIFEKQHILASPKPSSYKDYLKLKRGIYPVSYNEEFEIRGLKQYWLRAKPLKEEIIKNADQASHLPIMDKGSCFQGKIRFKNLNEEELGLVLWGLLLNEESRQNIGKGKPYGYGKIRVELVGLKRFDCEKAYQSERLVLDPMTDIKEEAGKFIEIYKRRMSEILGKDLEQLPHIKEFFLMKCGNTLPTEDNIRYMSLDDYRQNDRKSLPGVEEVIAKSKKNVMPKENKV